MEKPTRKDILRMTGAELDRLLNHCLVPFMADHRMGNRERHYSVNRGDAADAKTALRELGFKFKFAELDGGCAAAFSKLMSEETPYQVGGERTEEIASARAAAITIIEMTDLFTR